MTCAAAKALPPIARSMSGGNQQKAIIAREVDKEPDCWSQSSPPAAWTSGAIEYIHKQIVAKGATRAARSCSSVSNWTRS